MSLDAFSPDLSRPRSIAALSQAIGVSTPLFEEVISSRDPEALYRLHKIYKRASRPSPPPKQRIIAGGIVATELTLPDDSHYRFVWESIRPSLKLAHKSAAVALTSYLSKRIPGFPHVNAYGYIRGRSTRDHAARHKGATRLVGADIKDFFQSISVGRVELALRRAHIHSEVSGALARFLTIDDKLPLGLNASPVIANLVTHPLDLEFTELAKQRNCIYTRYADDLTFSGEEDLPTLDELRDVLAKHHFTVNVTKFRTSKRGQRHYVTGLSVADPVRPHAPRKLKKRLRQELFFIEKFGLLNHLSKLNGSPTSQHVVNRIDGMVNYISSVEPTLAQRLRSTWEQICATENVSRSFEPRPLIRLRESPWFIDEIELEKPDGTKLLALCCVEAMEIEQLEDALTELATQEAGDAFGLRRDLAFHWVNASISQREMIAKLLATQSVRAIVALDCLPSSDRYAETYLRLLTRALDVAMRSADDAVVTITIEANRSKVSETSIRQTIDTLYSTLTTKNQRRPVDPPTVLVVPKGARPALCVPDALLGAFAGYVRQARKFDERVPIEVSIFERIRSRYALILDEHLKVAFTARKPFKGWPPPSPLE